MARLLIVGEGPVSAVLDRLARLLGWETCVALALADVEAQLPTSDAVAVLAHHEELDGPALQAALASSVRYIGAMGSRRTQERRAAWLAQQGVTDLSRIHGPAGLDIGADGPEEIALSIMAEVIAVRRGVANPTSLRGRTTPLHPDLAAGEAYCPGG